MRAGLTELISVASYFTTESDMGYFPEMRNASSFHHLFALSAVRLKSQLIFEEESEECFRNGKIGKEQMIWKRINVLISV
jgi:hypothetical protein